MALLKYSVTHNGSTWSSTNLSSSIMLSNGTTTDSITAAGTRTLNCAGKVAANDIIIGDKRLNCADMIMADNVVITTTEATPTTTQIAYARNAGGYVNYSTITWDEVENSSYSSSHWKFDDELDYPTYCFNICCDGNWLSMSDAVSQGYVSSYTYYRMASYAWYDYTTSVKDTSFHTGSYVNFRWTNDSQCSGIRVDVETIIGKNVTGTRLLSNRTSEWSFYQVDRTTYS